MTGALHASFNTLLQLNKTVEMGAIVARSFLHAYGGWPDNVGQGSQNFPTAPFTYHREPSFLDYC